MSLAERIHNDMVAAMKRSEAERVSTLRMAKAAIKNREIEKRAPLDDAEAAQVLGTMIKQRRESIEQFTQGNRPELAAKEAAEIVVLEEYLPKEAGEAEIRAIVTRAIADMAASGARPGPKEMGAVMKAVQTAVQAAGLRADGRIASGIVKAELAK